MKRNDGTPPFRVILLVALTLAAGCGRRGMDDLERGIRDLKADRHAKAARRLARVVEQNPDDAAACAHLAIAEWKLGEDDQAIDHFNTALRLTDNDTGLLTFAGLTFLDMERFDEARKALTLAAAVQPTAELQTARAAVEIATGRPEEAAELLREALELDPAYPPALYNRAILAKANGNGMAATNDFRLFLQVAGDDRVSRAADTVVAPSALISPAAVNTAVQFLGLDSSADRTAKKKARRARTAPDKPPAERGRATGGTSPAAGLLADARRAIAAESFDEALILLAQARQADAANPDVLWALCLLYHKTLQYTDKATAAYEDFARRFPSDPRAAQAEQAARELTGAGTADETAWPWETNPAPPDAALAQEAFRDGLRCQGETNWQSAIAFYKRALMYQPRLADAAYNLGLAFKANENLNQARDAFRYTVKIAPDMPMAHYMLGVTCRQLGDNVRAATHLETCLRIRPNYARAHYLLGIIRREQKNEAQAIEHLRRYAELAPHDDAAKQIRQWLDTRNRGN